MIQDYSLQLEPMTLLSKKISSSQNKFNYIPDPHTACCFNHLDPNETSIILATVHPAKFPETIEESINESLRHEDLEKLKQLNPQKTT